MRKLSGPPSFCGTKAAADDVAPKIGMNAPGEIAALTRLVRPHVAMITAIEAAHLGFFPSIEAIADAKGEIFQGLEADGIAVLNADSPHFRRLAALAEAVAENTEFNPGEVLSRWFAQRLIVGIE